MHLAVAADHAGFDMKQTLVAWLQKEGHRVEATGSGKFKFSRPDGQEIPTAPGLEGSPVLERADPEEAVAGIEGWLTEAGADADWKALDPEWDGGRLDLDYAIDALWSSGDISDHEEVN